MCARACARECTGRRKNRRIPFTSSPPPDGRWQGIQPSAQTHRDTNLGRDGSYKLRLLSSSLLPSLLTSSVWLSLSLLHPPHLYYRWSTRASITRNPRAISPRGLCRGRWINALTPWSMVLPVPAPSLSPSPPLSRLHRQMLTSFRAFSFSGISKHVALLKS